MSALLVALVIAACGRKAPPLPPIKQPGVETEAPESQLEESPTLGGEDAPAEGRDDTPPAVPPYP
ncbi:putative small lipoprotein YifL [Nitrospina gracilis]|uniref:hypothetical protein n=1 Tax=Nitrospina TaxID=35800 RepID=UPI00118376CD|nr:MULTISPECIES: hypothetical protein [Nitrospina]MCF8722943.1 putative small lipoprotein YifL [Nitrospina sp. Nb-3]